GDATRAFPQHVVSNTVTIPQVITGMTVDSYGAPVQVQSGDVSRVQVTERLMYNSAGAPPAVTQSVSGGHLTLADPACAQSDCEVAFTITTPADVTATVSSSGGPVMVSGVKAAILDSGGGQVSAQQIGGPLTISSGGGPIQADGVAGTLNADSGGGLATLSDITAANVSVSTEGGPAMVSFAAAPKSVAIHSGGGMARLAVPGGPYALTADSGGGPENVQVATDPSAHRSITITSDGGPMLIEPADGAGFKPADGAGFKPPLPVPVPVPVLPKPVPVWPKSTG
ncbi:MAG TPA: hypothetical protein VF482_01215, partial [Trebonia sp.]